MRSAYMVSPPRIFILDNSIADGSFMSNHLLHAGYKVDFTIDGRVGLANILKNPPQCLIINSILHGMSGYAICRHVRTLYAYSMVAIIIVSPNHTALDQNYSLKVGANHYLAKPFSGEVLLQTVQKMIPEFVPDTIPAQTDVPVSQLSPSKTAFPPEISTLIPYRPDENDIMLKNNPFARTAVISDVQARRLYAAIDGDRNIQELATMVQLDLVSTLQLLKTLWKQKHIAFFDAKRHPFHNVTIFDRVL